MFRLKNKWKRMQRILKICKARDELDILKRGKRTGSSSSQNLGGTHTGNLKRRVSGNLQGL